MKANIMMIFLLGIASQCFGVEYKSAIENHSTQKPVPQIIDKPYARDYVLLGKGKWDESIAAIVKADPLFEQGNKMLTDKSLFVQKSIPVNLDPEQKTQNQMHVVSVADYSNAIKQLVQSAKTYQNPVSAYEAVTISLQMFGKGLENPISSDMYILTKLLYKSEVCDGYILYGEQLERTGSQAMAYEVYKNGSENHQCTGWYQSVLGGKLSLMNHGVGKK